MTVTTILNVVIGLIFTWLVFSLAAMYIQEWMASRLRWRSKMLETTISNMLGDPALADQFYNHPLIRSLYSGKDGTCKPSYIPSSQFAQALFDLVRSAPSEASLMQQQLYKLRWEMNRLSKRQQKNALKRLSLILALTRRALVSQTGDESVNGTLDSVRSGIVSLVEDYPRLGPAVETALNNLRTQKEQVNLAVENARRKSKDDRPQDSTLDQLRLGLAALSVGHPRLTQTLQALLNGAEEYAWQGDNVLLRTRETVEEWFNNSMDRLSGWYKRRAQMLAFSIGLVLAFMANGDSLTIANELWREPQLSSFVASQAEAFVNQYPQGTETLDAGQIFFMQVRLTGMNLPMGWLGTPAPLVDGAVSTFPESPSLICSLMPAAENEVFGLAVANQCYPIINTPYFYDLTGWLLKTAGLLVTALATAQGAPFWFEVLKKVINIRISGANPSEISRNVG